MELVEIETKIGKVKTNLKSEKFKRNLAMTNIGLCIVAPNLPGMDNSFSDILFPFGIIAGALALNVFAQNIGSMKKEISNLEEQEKILKLK